MDGQGWGRTVSALWRSTHPEPTAGVTAVLGLLAVTAGARWRTVPLAAAVLTNQLSIGWDNDALDAVRDTRNARTDKPIAAGELSVTTVRRSALVAAASCALLSATLGRRAAVANLTCVASGWVYNHHAKVTIFSVLPYLVGFAALPATVPLTLGVRVPRWLPASGALLGAAAHFANVVPDIEEDLLDGVRGLPQRLGAPASRTAFAGLLVAATAVLAVGSQRSSRRGAGAGPAAANAGVVLAAGGLAGIGLARTLRQPGSRALFRTAIGVVLADVVLLVARGGSIR